jgi:penicillin amidase
VAELFELDDSLLTADALRARAVLESWDYRQDADSAPSAYYNAVWREVLALVFHDELDADLRPDGGERWFEVMTGIMRSASAVWWDDARTQEVELRDEVLARALNAAAADLGDRLGADPTQWRWDDLHQLHLTHGTLGESGIAPLEALFNRGPVPVSGGAGIVNANGWIASEGFDVTWVPSMRMVVDLAHLDASRWVQLTGQSGHVFDPHYTDQVDAWASGETYPWLFSVDAARTNAVDRLVLTP